MQKSNNEIIVCHGGWFSVLLPPTVEVQWFPNAS